MNGARAVSIVNNKLVELGVCQSLAECSKKEITTYGEGMNALNLYIKADLSWSQAADILAAIKNELPDGKVNIYIIGMQGKKEILASQDIQ